jgi:hypothetical protein
LADALRPTGRSCRRCTKRLDFEGAERVTEILTILQARMSSSRLPGKVMRPLLGQPMMTRQIERLRRARRLQRLVVATSVNPEDDVVAETGAASGCEVYRTWGLAPITPPIRSIAPIPRGWTSKS